MNERKLQSQFCVVCKIFIVIVIILLSCCGCSSIKFEKIPYQMDHGYLVEL